MKITIPLSYDSANYPYNEPAAELELSETDSGECITISLDDEVRVVTVSIVELMTAIAALSSLSE